MRRSRFEDNPAIGGKHGRIETHSCVPVVDVHRLVRGDRSLRQTTDGAGDKVGLVVNAFPERRGRGSGPTRTTRLSGSSRPSTVHSAAITPVSRTPFLQPAVLASKSGSVSYFSWMTVTISGPGILNWATTGGAAGTDTETVQSPVRRISAGVVTWAAAPIEEMPQIATAKNMAGVDISVPSLVI